MFFPLHLIFQRYYCSIPFLYILSLLLSSTPKFLHGQYVSSNFFPYFFNYVIPPFSSSPFRSFPSYSAISYGWQPLSWQVPCYISLFLTRTYLFQAGRHSQFRFNTPYHSSYLSILVLFQLMSSVLFPTVLQISRSLPILLSPTYCSFCTIRFIRSRCESVRIASILDTCALPFPTTSVVCASQGQHFDISTPRYACIGLRS